LRTLVSKRPGGSFRRRGAAAAGVAAFAGLFIVTTAVPAFAHTTTLTGSSVCSDGAHVITWTIESLDTTLPMHVASATATLDSTQQFPVDGAVGMDIPENTSITASTTIPGNLIGTVELAVHGTWSDLATADATTSVSLTSECTPGDTSTTSTTATTSTTESTTSTTVEGSTTTAPTTSTTVESSTTVPSSTTTPSTPITGEGSTVQSTTSTVVTGGLGSTTTSPPSDITAAGNPTGSGNLPFTGSTDSGPIVGLTSLVGGAFALVFARRRRSHP
jgi:hypothetical protein